MHRVVLLIGLALPALGCQAFLAQPSCHTDANCPSERPLCALPEGVCVAPPDAGPDGGPPPDDGGPPPPPPDDGGPPPPPPDDGGPLPDDGGPPPPPPVDGGPVCTAAPTSFNSFNGQGGSGKCDPWSRSNADCRRVFTCQSGDHVDISGTGSVTRTIDFRDFDRGVEICFFYGETSGAGTSSVTLELDPDGSGFVELFRDDDFDFGDNACQEACVDVSALLPAAQGDPSVQVRLSATTDTRVAFDTLVIQGERCD